MGNEHILKEAPIGQLMIKLCVPTIVVMLVIVVYNMADIFFIGQTGDSMQVAALSLSTPLFSVLQALGTLLGSGACTAIAVALGQKKYKDIQAMTSFCACGSLIIGVLFAVIVLIFTDPLVALLGGSARTTDAACTYIRILSLGSPAIIFANVFANVVRSDGSAKQSMIGNGIGTLTNIILDPLFILVFHMGIAGAAIATVIGNIASCTYLIIYILRKQKNFSLSPKKLSLRREVSWDILLLGVPMAAGTLLMSFSSVFMNKLLAGYGDIVLAASGVSGKIGMLLSMIAMGICMGIQPAISYSYGSGNMKRMKNIIVRTGITTIGIGSTLTLICFIFRNSLINVFINDPQVIAYGQIIIIGSLVTAPVYGLYQLCSAFLQSTRKVSYATFVSLLRQGIIYAPTLFIMNALAGLNELIFSAAISDVLSIIVGLLLSFRWYKKISMKKNAVPLIA